MKKEQDSLDKNFELMVLELEAHLIKSGYSDGATERALSVISDFREAYDEVDDDARLEAIEGAMSIISKYLGDED